jgi:hypothetical protein
MPLSSHWHESMQLEKKRHRQEQKKSAKTLSSSASPFSIVASTFKWEEEIHTYCMLNFVHEDDNKIRNKYFPAITRILYLSKKTLSRPPQSHETIPLIQIIREGGGGYHGVKCCAALTSLNLFNGIKYTVCRYWRTICPLYHWHRRTFNRHHIWMSRPSLLEESRLN